MSATFPNQSPAEEGDNPYAPPRAEVGTRVEGDGRGVSESESLRRAYLHHEASVQSLGSLHYLGAFFLGIAFLGFLSYVATGRNLTTQSSVIAMTLTTYGGMAAMIVALGLGLRRLRPWARWTEAVLNGLGLMGSVFGGLAGLVMQVYPLSVGYGFLGLIQGYILFLLVSAKGSMVFSREYHEVIERTPHIRYRTSRLLIVFLVAVAGLLSLAAAFVLFR